MSKNPHRNDIPVRASGEVRTPFATESDDQHVTFPALTTTELRTPYGWSQAIFGLILIPSGNQSVWAPGTPCGPAICTGFRIAGGIGSLCRAKSYSLAPEIARICQQEALWCCSGHITHSLGTLLQCLLSDRRTVRGSC